MIEKTLIFFKPNLLKRREGIPALYRFFKDMRVIKYKTRTCSIEFFKKFYFHVPEPHRTRHAKFCSSGPIGIAILEGSNAIKKARERIGATDSSKASPKSLRGYYYRKYQPSYGYENFIHCSEDKKSVIRDARLFKISL